ncbi:GAF domain-containing protein [Aggregatilineales bacterium SYSU G02658]
MNQPSNPTAINVSAGLNLPLWRGLVASLGVGALVFLAFSLLFALSFFNRPFIGLFMLPNGVILGGGPTSAEPWTGLSAGLMRGDRLVAVNGVPIDPSSDVYPQIAPILGTLRVGDPITVTVERPTSEPQASFCETITRGVDRCIVTYPTMAMPSSDLVAYFLVPFIAGVFTFIIGAVVWRYQRGYRQGDGITAICWLIAIFSTGLFHAYSTHQLEILWVIIGFLLSTSLISISLTFPQRLRLVRRYPSLPNGIVVAGLALGIGFNLYRLNVAPDVIFTHITFFFATASLILSALILRLGQRPLCIQTTPRRQVDIALIGMSLLIFPAVAFILYQYLIANVFGTPTLQVELLLPMQVFPAAALALALFQHQRIDTDRFITQSIAYSLMLIALLLGTFLLSLGGTLIAIDLLSANNIVSITLILFVMVMLFTPARTAIQNRIDAIYFRTRRNYTELVEEFSQFLVMNTRYDDIVAEYRRLIADTLVPETLFIFVRSREGGDYSAYDSATDVRFSADSSLIELLRGGREAIILLPDEPLPLQLYTEQARLRLLRAHVIAPMKSGEEVIGFVIISLSRSGRFYGYEELRFFTLLTAQFAVGTERTQVIDSLEQRVRELDVLSQVSQAVNFTIEFDDLLELIYAQTSKLINADCFYIALYNEALKQLTFSFFLEGDDRDPAKEALHWPLDDGLFSQVVRTNAPVQTTNYAQEMARRGVSLKLESPHLRAWMGVPLTAGRRMLGVLAVGKTSHESFSEEQVKIFSDIAALAATSIDKARLFAETRQRERQLTVLNDISRQLVATESDVEKLLQIIMTSAVEILNGEAGSLLLTAEDDPTKLEFRVVIGGAENLLKTRIPSDKGIAGQVMKTGKAVIVNNLEETRANQMVTDTYKTEALLAVPLTAKDTVIGVLEVLNKRDGTGFVQEDSDLLTAFASQAAVAIENARLFRMTDLQLAQRVRELEALEKIDSELNRTLDVSQVATITVRSALQTLNAQAGALGIVHETTKRLEIVGIEGYTPEEYPAGADGLMWSLETGILKRVMRSRQPDLATDVRIDPDYTPGLHGSLSQMTLPMFSGDTINAILILEKSQLPRFTLSDWAFAQRLAEHASIAIANAQLYDALTQANKSKSEFMGFAAHELKNPLTSVIGFADLLRQGMTGALNEQQQGLINIIHSNANRMQSIIADLRDSAKMDANEFSVDLAPMQIARVVQETVRPFAQFMRDKQQTLVNQVPDDLPLVMGDENRLIQVLTNLVSNAHKYSPENTTITITAQVIYDYVDRQGKRREPMLRISVIDQGIGISEEDQKRLFRERYFRSTNQRALEQPGTGLGMTLTYGIVEKHNGEIWVESELGKGSTFHVAIPLAPQIISAGRE